MFALNTGSSPVLWFLFQYFRDHKVINSYENSLVTYLYINKNKHSITLSYILFASISQSCLALARCGQSVPKRLGLSQHVNLGSTLTSPQPCPVSARHDQSSPKRLGPSRRVDLRSSLTSHQSYPISVGLSQSTLKHPRQSWCVDLSQSTQTIYTKHNQLKLSLVR